MGFFLLPDGAGATKAGHLYRQAVACHKLESAVADLHPVHRPEGQPIPARGVEQRVWRTAESVLANRFGQIGLLERGLRHWGFPGGAEAERCRGFSRTGNSGS